MKWMTSSTLATGLALCLACAVVAQQPGGGRGRGGPGGFGGGGGFGGFGGGFGGSLMLLADANVRKEIGLSDDKYEQLQEAQRASFEQRGNLFQGLRDLPENEREAKMAEARKKMQDDQTALETKFLTAAQRERLKQLGVQSRINRGGVGEAIASDEIASELGLSEADKEKIRQAAEKAREEMQAQIQKLQEQAREKVIASMNSTQQAKLKQMMGAKFEFANNFGGFGGGGFGAGGFGGGFGGGGGRGGPGGAGGPGGFGGGRGGPGGGQGGPGRGGPPARPPVERLPDGD